MNNEIKQEKNDFSVKYPEPLQKPNLKLIEVKGDSCIGCSYFMEDKYGECPMDDKGNLLCFYNKIWI